MAFALTNSLSALLSNATGALFNFAAATTVRSVRLTNTSVSAVSGVSLFFDYDGTGTGAVDCLLSGLTLAPGESVLVDGGPFNFANGGRISGVAGTASVISCHITPATI